MNAGAVCLAARRVRRYPPGVRRNVRAPARALPYAGSMEPINFRRGDDGVAATRLLPGLILVGLGALFLLDNLRIISASEWARYWPVILVAVGLYKMVEPRSDGDRVIGGVLTVAGLMFLGDSLGLAYLGWENFWPLALIGLGLLLLFQRLPWGGGDPANPGSADGTPAAPFDDVAVFGGSKRVVTGEFKGGNVTAIFGGVELDLRNAVMTAPAATIEVTAIFGGAEIRVPEYWSVSAQCPGIFGGFNDRSHQPDPYRQPPPKRLLVKGAAVFGGVNVKN